MYQKLGGGNRVGLGTKVGMGWDRRGKAGVGSLGWGQGEKRWEGKGKSGNGEMDGGDGVGTEIGDEVGWKWDRMFYCVIL